MPILADGRPGALTQIWESGPADAPDGCALAASGDIYVALVGASNQIVELSRSGAEIARFGQQYTGANGSPVPFDSPSGVAFLGTQLIIANQSYFAGSAQNQALLDLETGEPGAPVYVPAQRGGQAGGQEEEACPETQAAAPSPRAASTGPRRGSPAEESGPGLDRPH